MKRFMTLCLAILLVLFLCACSSSPADETSTLPSSTEAPTDNEETSNINTEIPSENPEQVTPTPTAEATKAPEQEVQAVHLGESIQNDNFTMTLDSMEILPEFEYSTSESSSISLYVEDGYQLLLVRGHIENTSSKVISDSSFMRKVIVNDNYEVEDYDVGLSFKRNKYFEIDPYTDLEYYLYINIPDKLVDQFDNAVFELGFNDDMEPPVSVFNADGSKTIEVDHLFSLSASAAELGAGNIGDETENPPEEVLPSAKVVAAGDNIQTEYWDITLAKAEIATSIFPVRGEGTGYESGDGHKFINLEFDIKNLDTDVRSFSDAISDVIVHCGQYDYKEYSMYYDMGSTLSVTMLKGNTTGPAPLDPTHLYVETVVSDEAIDAGDIMVDLTIVGNPCTLTIEK